MKKLVTILSVITLLLFATSCNDDIEEMEINTNCISFPDNGVIPVQCERCWPSDSAYSEWFDRCFVYVFLAGSGNDVDSLQMAADALCDCD